jgi:acetyltransferase-like isoleucine patch superfamily enzyme
MSNNQVPVRGLCDHRARGMGAPIRIGRPPRESGLARHRSHEMDPEPPGQRAGASMDEVDMTVFDSRIAEGCANELEIRAAYDTSLWDSGVLVRYPPERSVPTQALQLGAGARLRSGTIIYAGSIIGRALDTGHNVIIREEGVIGDDVYISSNSVVDYGCRLGNDVRIESNCYLSPLTTVEDDVVIGAGCTFTTECHSRHECADLIEGPVLRRGSRIGVNVSILPGVIVGRGALVGSGSVVTRDVPDGAVAVGVPARVVCRVEELNGQAERAVMREGPTRGGVPGTSGYTSRWPRSGREASPPREAEERGRVI